ncbi:hypothetical protein BCD67_16670 [Oscillatoriales cyanobacterium USR001]|nr:hypothetical protein BCD67_16670 [Oscillatoriales cyanobacterium USR001]
MNEVKTKLPTDTWVTATWEEYLEAIADPVAEKAKGYYHNRQMRLEMLPVGNDHASDHVIIIFAVNLFAMVKGIAINGKDNCTYRKTGIKEAQPDVSYYIGEKAVAIPWGTYIINLDIYPPPALVIEVANTSIADDKGEKRLMYEDLKVKEYWILDVKKVQITPFSITEGGSKRISESQVLPGLSIAILEEALRRSRQMNQAEVGAWLLSQFQQ